MSRHHGRMNLRRWAVVRRVIFERDGWRCTVCGLPGALEAHHEPPLRAGADPYALDGIRTLCRGCHIERHRTENDTPGRTAWRRLVSELQ